jgi:hypothetical protein
MASMQQDIWLVDRIKIVDHLILNYFWKENNLIYVVLEFDGVWDFFFLHIIRLRELLKLK